MFMYFYTQEPEWESAGPSAYAPQESSLLSHGSTYSDENSYATKTQSWNSDVAASSSDRGTSKQITGQSTFKYHHQDVSGTKNSRLLTQAKDFTSNEPPDFDCANDYVTNHNRGFQFTTKYNQEQKAVCRSDNTNPPHGSLGTTIPSSTCSKWSKYADLGQDNDDYDDEEVPLGEGAQEFKTVTEIECVSLSSEHGSGVSHNVDRVQTSKNRTDAFSNDLQPSRQPSISINDHKSRFEQTEKVCVSGSDKSCLVVQSCSIDTNANRFGMANTSVMGKCSHQTAATPISNSSHEPSVQNVLKNIDNSLTNRTNREESAKSCEERKDHQGQRGTTVFQLPEEDLEHLPDDFDEW